MEILKCKGLEKLILENLKERIKNLSSAPSLVMISVGEDPASKTYVAKKEKVASQLGINAIQINLPETVSESDLLLEVRKHTATTPTIVQLPLPSHINTDAVIQAINPATDVDGFSPSNVGSMLLGHPCFLPATPKGILKILEHFNIDVNGKRVAVVGRSNIVGRPVANLLSDRSHNATVTLCHSRTPNLSQILKQMDVIVVATGRPGTINVSDVRNNAVIVDVGVNRVPDESERGWHLEGDFNPAGVESTDIRYTPVPGGVGLLTVAMLMENTVEFYEKNPGIFSENSVQ